MKHFLFPGLLTVFLFSWLTSCNEEVRKINFNLNTPLRVAILPFEDISSKDSYISKPFATGINYIPLLGGDDPQAPATLVREKFTANLKSSNLDPILNTQVDQALIENNLYDIKKLKSMDLQRLEDMLNVDAVIFGELTHWDRDYYVADSSVTVGIKVKMIDVSNKEVLWEHHFIDSERRGITKVPTGYVSAVLEPLRGLSNELFIELSDDVCRRIVDSIRPEKQSEFQEVSLPNIAHAIFQYQDQKKELLVVAIGEPKISAFFLLGKSEQQIPMTEVSAGQYIGQYQFHGKESYSSQNQIMVRFVNSTGQSSTYLISSKQALSEKLDKNDVLFMAKQEARQ
ncbi:MAG: GNA1162 family protein [Planctomycetota bacterium]